MREEELLLKFFFMRLAPQFFFSIFEENARTIKTLGCAISEESQPNRSV